MTNQMLASAAAVILTTALLAPPRTLADEPQSSAATVTRYSILFFGKPAGAQTTTVGADGRIAVEFSYRENGHGPDLHEEITLAPDGTPVSRSMPWVRRHGMPPRRSMRTGAC
jgi:hypothetical protein